MKFAKIAVAAALATAALPGVAYAQDVTTGATVYGPNGNPVGTVESVTGGVVTLDTGAHKAPLPTSAFGKSDKGPTITVTKEQLDNMMAQIEAQAAAKRDAALVVGAAAKSADGQDAGTIKSVDADDIVLETAEGPVALKRQFFAVDASGTLVARYTKAQLVAAASAGGSDASGSEAAQ
ncbi:hypothetical protein [Tsuneonella mangrovi]|uniref:hypothetical protein n=1 Tax=Tsuneonella mangrovi TaxID=1982042 RepID=UPI000BA1CEB2|nr:hypothetical protein [Tsuneonella mangrovi]